MKYYATMKINNLQLQATMWMVSYKQNRLVKEASYKNILFHLYPVKKSWGGNLIYIVRN